jgi:hypothetical protein
MSRKAKSPSLIAIVILIFAAGLVAVVLRELVNFGIAQGQVNITSLTPQQKAAICDPSNPKLNHVNTTESKICGLPVTPSGNATSANMTTGAPSAIPLPEG